MEDTNTDLLTMKDVMAMLKIHYNTLCRYISTGLIPVVFITRNKRFVRKQDLELFLNDHTYFIKNKPKDSPVDTK